MRKATKRAGLLVLASASWAMAQQPVVPPHILLPALNAQAVGPADLQGFSPSTQARTLGEHMESSNNNYAKYIELYKNIKLRELAPDERQLQTPATPASAATARRSTPVKPPLASPANRKAVRPKQKVRQAAEPRIWYLSGLGDRITAELIYERRLYRLVATLDAPLDAALDQQRVGPWVLMGMDHHSVSLQLSDSPRNIKLEAPKRGEDLNVFLEAMGAIPDQVIDKLPLPKSGTLALPSAESGSFTLPLLLPKP
jgi:hypothetical protein